MPPVPGPVQEQRGPFRSPLPGPVEPVGGRGRAEAKPSPPRPGVLIQSSQTVESSGLYTLRSVLKAQLLKEDKDAHFYCELSYLLPSGSYMKESRKVSVPVFCECRPSRWGRAWGHSCRPLPALAGVGSGLPSTVQTQQRKCGWKWSPRGS